MLISDQDELFPADRRQEQLWRRGFTDFINNHDVEGRNGAKISVGETGSLSTGNADQVGIFLIDLSQFLSAMIRNVVQGDNPIGNEPIIAPGKCFLLF